MATAAREHTTTTTTTEERPKKKGSILDQILDHQGVVDILTPLVPRGVSMSRIRSAIKLEERKNPKLKECTPESIVDAVARALRMDLDIGTEYYLVPFKDRGQYICTGVISYKAHVALAMRCGAVRSVQAHCVYADEPFRITFGTEGRIEHEKIDDREARGPLRGAYYIVRLPYGEHLYDFLPLADIEEVRAKSKQWNPEKVRECPPWWAKKRAVIVGLGMIPKNPRHRILDERLAADTRTEFDAEEQLAALDEMDEEDRPTPEDVDAMPPHPPVGAPSRAVSTAGYGSDDAPVGRATALANAGEILAGEPSPYDLDEAEGHHASTFDAAGSDDDDAQGELVPRPARRGRNALAEG